MRECSARRPIARASLPASIDLGFCSALRTRRTVALSRDATCRRPKKPIREGRASRTHALSAARNAFRASARAEPARGLKPQARGEQSVPGRPAPLQRPRSPRLSLVTAALVSIDGQYSSRLGRPRTCPSQTTSARMRRRVPTPLMRRRATGRAPRLTPPPLHSRDTHAGSP
jgi:hypothetical protein